MPIARGKAKSGAIERESLAQASKSKILLFVACIRNYAISAAIILSHQLDNTELR